MKNLMQAQIVQLIDPLRTVLATAQVADEGEYLGGTVDLSLTPPQIRLLCEEFEEIVNGQLFSFLDEVQTKIAALSLTAVFDDGTEARVKDLQVYPSTGNISFRFAAVAVKNGCAPTQRAAPTS